MTTSPDPVRDDSRPRTLSIIAALGPDGVIGHRGDLPWRLPADLQRFKHLTMGHHLLMGRKTFDSLGRALPGRTSVVMSRSNVELPEGVLLANSWERALELSAADEEAFVIGGADLFRISLPQADRLYLTFVEGEFEGDVFFPDWDPSQWRLVQEDARTPDEKNRYAYRFCDYVRA
ncbi:MAG TPA: dihydrofolate reductase [Pirellulaceae bacterium]|nr:dihydrofolate reductase [Pirellulaceae bacterium]